MIQQPVCEVCGEIAPQGEALCDGCRTDSFVMQWIHSTPESDMIEDGAA